MNKNIKRIIALALIFGTFSAVAPATNINLLTTKVHAATDDENDDTTLDSLGLESSSGSTIKLYSDSGYDSDSKLDDSDTPDEDTYYAKTSSNIVNVKTEGPTSRYVKVFKGTSSSTKGKSISSDISLSSGTTTIVVRVYNNKPDSDVRYDDDSDVASEYKIKVKYTGSDSSTDTESSDASDYDDIYLDRLSVEGESITLSDSKINYTYNVASDVDEATVKATPSDEDNDTVTIDGSTVDDSDKYKKTVSLDKGDNKIKIEVEDEDSNYREYTLNIIRGTTTSTGTSTTTNNTASTTPSTATNVSTAKVNQWVPVNGKWQYNDALGNPIKNILFNDKNLGKTYYLQADGNMATGWITISGKWYYFGGNGSMQTGWIIDGGKYYYLYSDGTMASNTTIGGYKVGPSGAWVG